jgi:hypothetical protein
MLTSVSPEATKYYFRQTLQKDGTHFDLRIKETNKHNNEKDIININASAGYSDLVYR